jgi:hypothetical protein
LRYKKEQYGHLPRKVRKYFQPGKIALPSPEFRFPAPRAKTSSPRIEVRKRQAPAESPACQKKRPTPIQLDGVSTGEVDRKKKKSTKIAAKVGGGARRKRRLLKSRTARPPV